MQHKTPNMAGAQSLLAHFAERGVSLSVQHVREPDDTHWWRVWLRGGRRLPGDFEAISRVKPELVELLRAQGNTEPEQRRYRRRRPLKSRTTMWNGPTIPPMYRGLLAELRAPRR
ncbi:hypothetical protein EON83_26460 [bacterium]|nr:MAG: hypothetical protein EON83_26460 [bacterium]